MFFSVKTLTLQYTNKKKIFNYEKKKKIKKRKT